MCQTADSCPLRGICRSTGNSDSKGPGLMYSNGENSLSSRLNADKPGKGGEQIEPCPVLVSIAS
jgi:hypothetical protein